MAPSKRTKGRDGVISALDVFIQTMGIAKDACGIPPAQIAFGSAGVLLTMIRVHSSLPCEEKLLKHAHVGHDGKRSGLRRPWADLR